MPSRCERTGSHSPYETIDLLERRSVHPGERQVGTLVASDGPSTRSHPCGRRDFYRQVCVALVEEDSRRGCLRVEPLYVTRHLDHLHILCNYEWDSKALPSLLLVGLPELRERLSRRHQCSLYSRIHHRLQVDSTSPEDTAEYIRHRLHLAGGAADRDIFTSDAVAMLHEGGAALRDIDRLAAAALRVSFRRKEKLVEREAVLSVIDADR